MLKNKICNILRKDILLGKLNPGERLIESELSEKHGISRGTIREALAVLNNEGFVTIIPNKGAIVAKISTQDIEDFYKLIAILEREAVELATPNITKADIKELTNINDFLRDTMTSDRETKLHDWGELNLSFHRFFLDRCGNAKLGWLVEIIRQRVTRFRYTFFMITSYDDFLKDHAQIIEYIKKNNPQKAGQVMEEHIYRGLETLLRYFS